MIRFLDCSVSYANIVPNIVKDKNKKMITIPQTYFFKFENWFEYQDSIYAGEMNLLYLKSHNSFLDFPIGDRWDYDETHLQMEGSFTRYKIVKDNNSFMQSLREEIYLFPRIKFCILENDFSDIEIQEMNDFISYLLNKEKDKKIE